MSSEQIFLCDILRTRVLRHMASELNLNMRSDGYVRVQDLLKLDMKTFANIPLRSHTIDDIREVGFLKSFLKSLLNPQFTNYLSMFG